VGRDGTRSFDARSPWSWLPAGATAIFGSPLVSGATLYVLSEVPYVALVVGVVLCAAITWLMARWFDARRHEAVGLAAISAGVALAAQFALWSGVR
jgi:hypothetical protein